MNDLMTLINRHRYGTQSAVSLQTVDSMMETERKPELVRHLIASLYLILYTFGVAGNLSVLWRVRSVWRTNKLPSTGTIIYVTALCCIDLATLISVLPTVFVQLFGNWIFG